MIQKVHLGMYSAKSGREEFYIRNPGMGRYRLGIPSTCGPCPDCLAERSSEAGNLSTAFKILYTDFTDKHRF